MARSASMRALVATLSLVSVVTFTASQPAPLPAVIPLTPAPTQSSDLADLPAYEVIPLLCNRNVTARQYVQALLDRYQAGGYECLNMWINFNATKALSDASAMDDKHNAGEVITPLCGMPLAVKDAIDVLGYPTTGATPALKDAYPLYNPPLIQQYLNANGIIMGKTNLAEMQATISSINPTSNGITTPLNPYDPTRISGGSSGGSGAVLATRVAPFALCEDTGGSCRSPAAANGIFGLRPTLGSYDVNNGVIPAFITTDTIGSMGRTADDLIMLDSIVRKPNCTTDGKGAIPDMVSCDVEVDRNLDLSGIRLGLPSTAGWGTTGISNEIAEVVQAALDKMKAAGVTLVPFDSSAINAAQKAAWPMGLTPGGFEVGVSTARWLYLHNYTLSLPELVSQINRPDTKTGYESYLTSYDNTTGGSDVNEINYLQEGRPHLTQAWIDAIEDNKVDALLYPAFRTEITRIDAGDSLNVITNATGTYIVDYYNDAMLYFLDAQAGITVGAFPIGMGSTGTPAGLQVASVPGDDETVMSLMLAFEKLLGPMPPPPRVAACSGCTANVTNVKPTYTVANVSAPLNSSGVWTQFGLTFGGGNCYQSTLNTYGQNGPYGVGLPVPNTTATHTVTGTTSGSVASSSIG